MAQVLMCDVCGTIETKKQIDSTFYEVGTENSQGDNTSVSAGKHFDLCESCKLKVLMLSIKDYLCSDITLVWKFNKIVIDAINRAKLSCKKERSDNE